MMKRHFQALLLVLLPLSGLAPAVAQPASQGDGSKLQVQAARALSMRPSECVMAYETALANAHTFADVRSYFSKAYLSRFTGRESTLFEALRRAYMRSPSLRAERVAPDGLGEVCLEGFDPTNHPAWIKVRLVPENQYWRIAVYDASTGMDVLKAPVITGADSHRRPGSGGLDSNDNIHPKTILPYTYKHQNLHIKGRT